MKLWRRLVTLIQFIMIIGILSPFRPGYGRLGRQVMSISVGDLNGDGTLDIAVGTVPQTIYALNTTGSILWTSQVSDSYVLSVKIADFDRDGVGDILAGSFDSNAYVITQNKTIWVYDEPIGEILSIATGNLDGDDVPDVIVGSADQNCYAVTGATGERLWVYRASFYAILGVTVADFNDDGRDDVIAAARDGIYSINGATGETLWINRDPIPGISKVCSIPDLNNDKIADVVVGAYTNVYAISGATGETLWVQTGLHGIVSTVIVGDFDNDQRKDVGAGTKSGYIYTFGGATGDPMWEHFVSELSGNSNQILSATTGDFDANGIDDVLVGTLSSRAYVISGSTGQLQWMNSNFPDRVVQVVSADVNQDGMSDALIASGPNVYVLDGQSGKLLWDTIGFWEHIGTQLIAPVSIIMIGLAISTLFIGSYTRKRKNAVAGEDVSFWFGQGKLGAIYVATLLIISALVLAIQKDWRVADSATKLWLSFLGTSFPIYTGGITILTVLKSPKTSKNQVKWVLLTILLLFAAHMGVFLYGLS